MVEHAGAGRLADVETKVEAMRAIHRGQSLFDELRERHHLGQLVGVQGAELALTEGYGPQGLNMGINLGKTGGAGVLNHLHMHVVPRWNGDTNFMTVVGETRVLPEELPETAKKLRPIFEKLAR